MTGNDTDKLYTLNTTTGTATNIGANTSFAVSENNPTGIASGYTKPADFAIASSTGAITYTGNTTTAGTEHTLYAQTSDNKNSNNNPNNVVDDTVPVTIPSRKRTPGFRFTHLHIHPHSGH